MITQPAPRAGNGGGCYDGVMRNKFLLMTAVLAAAIGAFSAWYFQQHLGGAPGAGDAALPPVGMARPDFQLRDLDNRMTPLSAWDGRVVLFNFWAAWCPPCRREIPAFSEVREFYREDGFEVVGIAIDDEENIREFLAGLPGVRYPQLIGFNDAVALGRALGNRSGGLPYSVLVDRDGIIRFARAGELTKAELIEQVEPLL